MYSTHFIVTVAYVGFFFFIKGGVLQTDAGRDAVPALTKVAERGGGGGGGLWHCFFLPQKSLVNFPSTGYRGTLVHDRPTSLTIKRAKKEKKMMPNLDVCSTPPPPPRTRLYCEVGSWNKLLRSIGVRDHFRLGGLRSVARIFSPLLARKSSGFARILHDFFFFFLPENGYLKIPGGGGSSPRPPPRTPMLRR